MNPFPLLAVDPLPVLPLLADAEPLPDVPVGLAEVLPLSEEKMELPPGEELPLREEPLPNVEPPPKEEPNVEPDAPTPRPAPGEVLPPLGPVPAIGVAPARPPSGWPKKPMARGALFCPKMMGFQSSLRVMGSR